MEFAQTPVFPSKRWCGSKESIPQRIWSNWSRFSRQLEWMLPDFEVLDSKFARALRKLLTASVKRRVHMEEQQTQQFNLDSHEVWRIAVMIQDNFKISETNKDLDFNVLLGNKLKNRNLQASPPSGTKQFSPWRKFPIWRCMENFAQQTAPVLGVFETKPLLPLYLQVTIQKKEKKPVIHCWKTRSPFVWSKR